MTHKTSEVMKVKKVLLVASLFLMCGSLKAADMISIAPGCGGADCKQLIPGATVPVWGILFQADGSTQTSASSGGGGGGGASFFTFTENTGNKTAISSMTFESPQWSNTTSGSSTTVRVNPSSVTLYGPFTSLALTNPTTIQVTQQSSNLRLISMNAYPFPLIVGNNAAGTQTGIAFQNGSVSTSAYISWVGNTNVLSLVGGGKDLLTLDKFNGVGIGTTAPNAGLHISSTAGSGSVFLFRVSTGPFDVFRVMGDSVVCNVPLISRYGVEYATSSGGGGGGAGGPDAGFAAFSGTGTAMIDAAGGFTLFKTTGQAQISAAAGFNLAQSTINSKLDNLIVGASFYIQNTSATTGGVFHISSGTVESTLTVKGGLLVPQVSLAGGGPLKLVGNGDVQFDSNNSGTPNFIVSPSSVSLAVGNFISLRDKDRFTTPAFGSGTFTTYIATPTMGIASSTLGSFQFNNAISSQANFCVFPWIVPDDIDLTASISVSSFGITLGAADTGGQVYQISIATNQASNNVTETKFSGTGAWTSSMTVVIAGDALGAAGDLETSTGTIVWGGVQNTIIPGTINYIIVSRDGDHGSDTSTVNSYSTFFTISYKRRFYQ